MGGLCVHLIEIYLGKKGHLYVFPIPTLLWKSEALNCYQVVLCFAILVCFLSCFCACDKQDCRFDVVPCSVPLLYVSTK